jgi:hypothetical protein
MSHYSRRLISAYFLFSFGFLDMGYSRVFFGNLCGRHTPVMRKIILIAEAD